MSAAESPRVILYVRPDCDRSSAAERLLAAEGIAWERRDATAVPVPEELRHLCPPLLLVDGRIRLYGKIGPLLLRRALAATAPADGDAPPRIPRGGAACRTNEPAPPG